MHPDGVGSCRIFIAMTRFLPITISLSGMKLLTTSFV